MNIFQCLIGTLGLVGLMSLVQIIAKCWLLTLEQIKNIKTIARLTNVLFIAFVFFYGKDVFSGNEMICLWIIWVVVYIIQRYFLRVSYDILAEFLMDNPKGNFIPLYITIDGEIHGDLLVNGIKMSAIACGGMFYMEMPSRVSIFVELNNYGNINRLLVFSIEQKSVR